MVGAVGLQHAGRPILDHKDVGAAVQFISAAVGQGIPGHFHAVHPDDHPGALLAFVEVQEKQYSGEDEQA